MELCYVNTLPPVCILCTATAVLHARVQTRYFINGACTLTPTPGTARLPAAGFELVDGVSLSAAPGVTLEGGELRLHNSDNVTITNVNASKRLRVTGTTARNLHVQNFRVTDDDVAISVSGGGGAYDTVDGSGSTFRNVYGGVDAAISLLHAVGPIAVDCAPDTQVLVQHFDHIDADLRLSSECGLINMTNIFNAFGSAYMFDAYGKRDEHLFGNLEVFTAVVGAAAVIVFLIAR